MGFSEQCSKNNIIFRHIGIQSRCRNKNTLITMVGPTIIFMTNGSSRPLCPIPSQFVRTGKQSIWTYLYPRHNSSILDLKEFSEGAETTSSVRAVLTVLYSMMFQNKLNHNNSFCVL